MSVGIAYLILASDQPAQLARLVRALSGPAAHFFIHVDRRADASAFVRLVPPSPHVQYAPGPHRVRVYWGGYSMVRATLALMRLATTGGIPFHRYCLLSNADYPIKSRAEIEERLSSPLEFIRIQSRFGTPEAAAHARNISRFHFADNPILNPKVGRHGRAIRFVDRWIGRLPRRAYEGIPLYHGSQWWALTDGCVRYILRFASDNPGFRRFMARTLVPDEIFFHSIIKASPFAPRIVHDFERSPHGAPNDHACHYIDWSRPGGPKVLDEGDLAFLRASAMLFARKFVEPHSSALLRRLEQSLTDARATEDDSER